MTFEEAIERLNNVEEANQIDFTDMFGAVDEDSLEIENYRLWAKEVFKTIDELQETYAPKIKMTGEQKEEFMLFVDDEDIQFEEFWFCMGSGNSLYKNLSENQLMTAWLYHESIEVVE